MRNARLNLLSHNQRTAQEWVVSEHVCGCSDRKTQSGLRIAGGLLPIRLLALLPKCPACLAMYVALGTGISLSFATASRLRITMIVIILASPALVWLISRRFRHVSSDQSSIEQKKV